MMFNENESSKLQLLLNNLYKALIINITIFLDDKVSKMAFNPAGFDKVYHISGL